MLPIANIVYKTLEPCRENVQFYMTKYEDALLVSEALSEHKKQLERFLFDIVFDTVKKSYPDHYVVEGDGVIPEDQEHIWTVRLRGNLNYMFRGLDSAYVAIAHYHGGKIQDVLMTSPVSAIEYIVSRGNGAQRNGKRIRVSPAQTLNNALIATDIITLPYQDASQALLSSLSKENVETVCSGSAVSDVLSAASGRVDLAVLKGLDELECVEALLIAQEAGALWGGLAGETKVTESSGCVLANPRLYKQFVTLARQ